MVNTLMNELTEQQPLIDFLEADRIKRNMEVVQFASLLGFSQPNQYYNLRNGKKSGPQQCIDMARALGYNPNYFLYLGGYIREDELDAPKEIPAELLPHLEKVSQMKGTPFFNTAVDLIEKAVDAVVQLFKVAA